MTSFLKVAAPAGIMVAAVATVTANVNAAQLDNAVREGQAVVTELDSASAKPASAT